MPDNLTPQQRSYCMSRVRTKNTDIEAALCSALHRKGLRFRKHVKALPGTPDIVFSGVRIAIFVDGDFWHGYHLHQLEPKLSEFWRIKIRKNRERDLRNFLALRHMGWLVIRVWKHSIKKDPEGVVSRVEEAIRSRANMK